MAMLWHCNIQGADTLKRMMADRGREGAVFSRMEPKHKQIVVKMLKDGQWSSLDSMFMPPTNKWQYKQQDWEHLYIYIKSKGRLWLRNVWDSDVSNLLLQCEFRIKMRLWPWQVMGSMTPPPWSRQTLEWQWEWEALRWPKRPPTWRPGEEDIGWETSDKPSV